MLGTRLFIGLIPVWFDLEGDRSVNEIPLPTPRSRLKSGLECASGKAAATRNRWSPIRESRSSSSFFLPLIRHSGKVWRILPVEIDSQGAAEGVLRDRRLDQCSLTLSGGKTGGDGRDRAAPRFL
jgi:hypothetical protein